MNEIAPGLHHWTARHPTWHPGEFGAEVGGYAALTDTDLLLIDPLVPEADPGALDGLLRENVSILITIGYHVRSAGELWKRWGWDVPVTVYGPPNAGKRLDGVSFVELEPTARGPRACARSRSAARFAASARSGSRPTTLSRSATRS